MITWVAGALLLGLVYFAVSMIGVAALTVVAAVGLGAGSVAFLRLLNPEDGTGTWVMPVSMAATATLGGALLSAAVGAWEIAPFAGVAGAALGAWLLSLGLRRQAHVACCSLCRAPVADRASFVCPRCHQTVCSRPTCWKGQHARCRLCHDREVVIFPIREDWWTQRLGKRAAGGTCHSCYKEAHEADLRECGQCHWASCRRCWDYHNGRCSRCGWVIPNLPPALRPFIAAAPPGPQRQ